MPNRYPREFRRSVCERPSTKPCSWLTEPPTPSTSTDSAEAPVDASSHQRPLFIRLQHEPGGPRAEWSHLAVSLLSRPVERSGSMKPRSVRSRRRTQAMSAAAAGTPTGSDCGAVPMGWLMSSPEAVAVFSWAPRRRRPHRCRRGHRSWVPLSRSATSPPRIPFISR